MPSLIKPRHLREGDRVAAVTLSWGGPGELPHRYDAGKRQLEREFGVDVVEMPHTLAGADFVADHPQARVDDLHEAFSDPSIAAIVSTIGGEDSIRLLPLLDLNLIAANPKVLLGYSDTTVTHMACLQAGLVSFYGPAIMAGFAENAGLHDYLVRGVRQMLWQAEAPTKWPANIDGWTDEFLDWADPGHQQRPRRLESSQGWRWLQGQQATEGPLIVGCLEVLDWLRGTDWWPPLRGAVLAIETSEEGLSPRGVKRFFRSLAAMGELDEVAALLFARPGGQVPPARHHEYDRAILEVVAGEAGRDGMPIVAGLDFGHTDPMWTLPQGIAVRVDPSAREIVFLESGVL